MTREELLARSKAQFEESTKKLQAEEEDKKNSYGFYNLLKYSSLNPDGYKLLRFIGTDYPRPVHKLKNYYNPVLFEQALCVDDKGKYRKVVGNPEKPNVLKKMYQKAKKEGTKDEITGEFHYKLAEVDPDLFLHVMRNGSKSVKMAGFDFKKSIGFNVIDREESDFHKKEKQTLLAAKGFKEKENDEGKMVRYYQDGLPSSWYESSYYGKKDDEAMKENFYFKNSVCEEEGLYFDYDVIVWKTKFTKERSKNMSAVVWYKSFKADKKLKDTENPIDKSIIADWDTENLNSPITEEEFTYKLYNLAKVYKPSSAKYIKANFKETIKAFDNAMGTSFLEELEEQIVSEEESVAEDKTPKTVFVSFENEPLASDLDSEDAEEVEEESPKEEEKKLDESVPFPSEKKEDPAPRRRAAASETSKEITVEILEKNGFGHAADLKPEEIKTIKSVSEGEMEFIVKKEDIAKCETCDFVFPVDWKVCPACGTKYDTV